jgi:hypothetical protein
MVPDGGLNMETWNVEVTDTFGGEANYAWCRRYTVQTKDNASRAAVMRAAKAAAGYSGVRGRSADFGDSFEFRPYGVCAVMFITYAGGEA